MADAVGMLQLFLDGLSPVLILTVVLGLSLSIGHGMVNIYKNI